MFDDKYVYLFHVTFTLDSCNIQREFIANNNWFESNWCNWFENKTFWIESGKMHHIQCISWGYLLLWIAEICVCVSDTKSDHYVSVWGLSAPRKNQTETSQASAALSYDLKRIMDNLCFYIWYVTSTITPCQEWRGHICQTVIYAML